MNQPATLAARRPSAVLHGLSIALLAAGAWSVTPSTHAQATTMPGVDAGAVSPYSLTVGAAVARVPAYEGSNRFDTRTLPVIAYQSGRFFAGTLSGVGYNLSNTQNLEFGPVLTYRFGRDESDDARLRGLGNIDAGVDVGAFVRWNAQPLSLSATLEQGVGGNVTGTSVRLNAAYALSINRSNSLRFDASVDWANAEVMQGFFGISTPQSARSGLTAYEASSGIRRYGVGAVWAYSITPQWFSTVRLGVYRLGSEAANSPLTVRRSMGLVSAGLSYRF
jgi:outer membrane scaffolding protein for murein synthesis (MipA/OmpV family)